MGFTIHGCVSNKTGFSNDLVVAELTDSVYGGNENNRDCTATFIVDAPVNGPQILVDSVMALVNRELYKFCEICTHSDDNRPTFSIEEVYTDDGRQLVNRYMDKYKSVIEDSLWNTFGFTLKMEIQTGSFVTYGLEYFHCGASCGSEKYYYSFDKKDGHQVKEIISQDNLVRFFDDYPEFNTVGADPRTGTTEWKFSPDYEFDNSCYGLLDNHFSLVILGANNHYLLTEFPYSQIFSYLSPDVQALLVQNGEEQPMLPFYSPMRSEDGQAWMEVDSTNCALLGYLSAAGGPFVDTLMRYEPEMEIYPKRVHSIETLDGSTVLLFIYSRGHLQYCDEAMTCIIGEHGPQPATLFSLEGQRDSVISCMWYDQLVEACNGFPFEEIDENRFGIHYDRFTQRLYYPIMENHEKGSGFENCLRYTGRYEVLQFNGKDFIPVGKDGAWWLNKDMRNYVCTISNYKTDDGIEQIDSMPNGSLRHVLWRGAKTLDDLRKKPHIENIIITNPKRIKL
jgi:hypothetical protein